MALSARVLGVTQLLRAGPAPCLPARGRGAAWLPNRAAAPLRAAADASADAQAAPPPPSKRKRGADAPPRRHHTGSPAADSLPLEKLRQLRAMGLAMKDVIKMGRRGPAEGLAKQVQQRWNSSEVARLYCSGKHAANMKVLLGQLEEATGGIAVHRAGGSIFLYRGDNWQPPPRQQPQEERAEGPAAEGQQAEQQAEQQAARQRQPETGLRRE